MSYATVEDVATELGRPASSITDAEREQWQAWLDRVERTIRRRFRREGLDLDHQVHMGDPSAEDVADVEVAAVARKVVNPHGDTSTTVSVDDGSVTRRREGVDTAIGLDLTDEEWDLLLPSDVNEPAAYTTRPTFTPDCRPWWC